MTVPLNQALSEAHNMEQMQSEDICSQYEIIKVGQLRLICKQRGLSAEGKKEELIMRLVQNDKLSASVGHTTPITQQESQEFLSADEMRELATIADEMRHIRRQWVRFY